MDTQSVWEFLFSVPIGKVLAWLIVIGSIITAIGAGAIKLYNAFSKYNEIKTENDEQKKLLKKHDEILSNINRSLTRINTSLDEQKDVNLKQVRYMIVHTCDDALAA